MIKTRGFSFIEVLISVTLITIILMMSQTLNLVALRQSKVAYEYRQASSQLMWMATALEKTEWKMQPALLSLWQERIKNLLPNGVGKWQEDHLLIAWGAEPTSHCTASNIGLTGCLIYAAS